MKIKISGRRLHQFNIGWDFLDYRGWGNPKTQTRKQWSKRLRRRINRILGKVSESDYQNKIEDDENQSNKNNT